MLYAESLDDSWFMLGLRSGRIEVQFKNQHSVKVTSGGKAINDGQWHVVSVYIGSSSGYLIVPNPNATYLMKAGAQTVRINRYSDTLVFVI